MSAPEPWHLVPPNRVSPAARPKLKPVYSWILLGLWLAWGAFYVYDRVHHSELDVLSDNLFLPIFLCLVGFVKMRRDLHGPSARRALAYAWLASAAYTVAMVAFAMVSHRNDFGAWNLGPFVVAYLVCLANIVVEMRPLTSVVSR